MNERVLLVEDDESLRNLLRRMLESDGYVTTVATNGKEGVEAAIEMKPDLMITDIMMPEMNGLAAIMRIKNDVPDIKIIAISGGGAAQGDYLEIAERLGVFATLDKPIRKKDFLNEVRKAIDS